MTQLSSTQDEEDQAGNPAAGIMSCEINFKSLSVLVLYFTVNADQCDDIIIDYPADELIDEIVRQKRKEQFGGKLTAPRRHRQE